MSIRVSYCFILSPAVEQAFLRFYRESLLPHLSQSPGFLGEVLLQDATQRDQYIIIGRWDSQQSFNAWRTAPDHQTVVRDLPGYLASRPQIRLYEPSTTTIVGEDV